MNEKGLFLNLIDSICIILAFFLNILFSLY